ncbi:hypothetical protein [Peribacillus muralis]|uniref:hypothetical protein n=1 Tax=Peribacillus muralis TaxID=264697 RepID=UPI00366ADC20
MSRLGTMARFEEPEDVKPVAECKGCNNLLFAGEEVVESKGKYFCETGCLVESLDCSYKTLGEI